MLRKPSASGRGEARTLPCRSAGFTYVPVSFYEAGLWVRSIESEAERVAAYRLRHEVFCTRLKWIPSHPSGLERDRYDAFATSVGLFTKTGRLVGLARFLPPDRPFMLEAEFAVLMDPGYRIRKEADTVELSRLAVASWRRPEDVSPRQLSRILYKGIYQWALANGVRYIYVVVAKRYWRSLEISGIPCKPIGPVKRLPPACVESVAALLDMEAFHRENRTKRSEFLRWMATVQSDHSPWPKPRHAPLWKPRAS